MLHTSSQPHPGCPHRLRKKQRSAEPTASAEEEEEEEDVEIMCSFCSAAMPVQELESHEAACM
jgi:hypothetical protein